MKLALKSFLNFTLGANDGEVGTINEIYFDDRIWTVKFIIVETGRWMSGRVVMIPPNALTDVDWDNAIFRVDMSMQDIRDSPHIDTEPPVSRRETARAGYLYPAHLFGETAGQSPFVRLTDEPQKDVKLHLRSSNAVTSYHIDANDGEFGHVHDFIIDTDSWQIEFLVFETGTFFSRRKMVLLPAYIKEINWSLSKVFADLSTDQLNGCQEFDEKCPVNVVYEKKLRDYHGRLVQ